MDDFFKKCKFYNKDTFYNLKNFKDKAYLEKNGILKKEENQDYIGNFGEYYPSDSFRICFLCCCKLEEVETLKKNIPVDKFEIYIVQ